MKNKKMLVIVSSIFFLMLITIVFIVKNKSSRFEEISPKKGKIIEAVYSLGKVKSAQRYEVKVGVLTSVSEIYVKEGDEVKKSQPLIKFRDTPIFKSAINGTVTSIEHYENETVVPQKSILTVENLQDRYIEVALEQDAVLRVKKGQSVKIVFEGLRGEVGDGTVTAVFPKHDEFLAHIKALDLKDHILPGMTADVSIQTGEKPDALLIPLGSVTNGMIIRKRENKKEKIRVKIGIIDGAWAEVLEGDIALNDLILTPKKK